MRDVARELLRKGHQPVCYSPVLGEVAEELHLATIPVVSQLNQIQIKPDVIHGQHHMETLTALLHFPGVPAVSYCHGWLPWEEAPLSFPRVKRFVVVDELGKERLAIRNGIPPERIAIISNFFDERLFRPNRPLPPDKPSKALAFSNAFDARAEPVRRACDEFGISLDVIGNGAGNPSPRPETVLPQYDIVFGRGRCAIEAMACGAAVIICGPRGVGPLINLHNLDAMRALNFGIRTQTEQYAAPAIAAQIASYDAAQAAGVTGRILREATLSTAVNQLIELYQEAIAANRAAPPDSAAETAAVAAYLGQWSPFIKDSASQAEKFGDLLREREEELAGIRASLTWRIPQAILNSKIVRLAAGPLLEALSRKRGKP